MEKKQYTKRQIIETIKHWKNVLKIMNESSSELLNAFAQNFSLKVVFSKRPFTLTDESALQIAKIINDFLFDSMIVDFPEIKVVTYGQFCKLYQFYEMTYCNKLKQNIIFPKNKFLGTHYVTIENDLDELTPTTPLEYSHKIIMMNLDKLKFRSFIMNAASICHEMIHEYDRQFGDGENVDRYCVATQQDPNKYSHRTQTFINKQNLAVANNLKVISVMDKKDKILDKEAIKLMLQALSPEELKFLKSEL